MLRQAYTRGAEDAFKKHGLAQPSLQSVGIKSPVKAPGLPGAAATTGLAKPPIAAPTGSAPTLGISAAKAAAAVGMVGAGTNGGAGAVRGEPADEGRRQQSVIDRTFQANEDNFAASSMPAPGASVSP